VTSGGWFTPIPERETWAATVDDRIVSWIAIKNDHVDGLYTDPHHSTRGIGSALLQFAEAVLEDRGSEFIGLEASPNAERFYRRRGYAPVGPRSTDGAQPMRKAVTPTVAVRDVCRTPIMPQRLVQLPRRFGET
jgi:predicted N-acetyltransferase YhbS